MDTVSQWLENMGESLGQEIKLDKEGRCAIECEDNVSIVLDSDEDSPLFFLSSPLMELPSDRDTRLMLMAYALSLNLFTYETRGATIALAEDTGYIMICFSKQKEFCDEKRFASIIENFYETVLDIRHKLLEATDTGSGSNDTGIRDVGSFV